MDDDGDKWLRMQGVANRLGWSRHTLRRVMNADPTFPIFVDFTPGIRMVRVRDVDAWVRLKELKARENPRFARHAIEAELISQASAPPAPKCAD
jgi:predicted DNA-binding transcriptional regulator AlpA